MRRSPREMEGQSTRPCPAGSRRTDEAGLRPRASCIFSRGSIKLRHQGRGDGLDEGAAAWFSPTSQGGGNRQRHVYNAVVLGLPCLTGNNGYRSGKDDALLDACLQG